MFERFTAEARGAVVRALDEARRMGAEQVEPEHLLLALACGVPAAGRAVDAVRPGAAARALAEAGLDADTIEQAMEQDLVAALATVGVPASVVESAPMHPRADRPAFSVPAKRALEQALRQAVQRGERKMGGEHVLLGLLEPPAVSVWRVLARLDIAPERLAALVQVEMAAQR